MDARKIGRSGLILGAAVSLFLYWQGADRHSQLVNTDMERFDQSAYMEYARNMHETHYQYIGGRNRMPVYPFLQSLFYRSGMTDQAFFEQGKAINIILSIVVLFAVSIFILRLAPKHDAINVILMTAFTVFIFRAAYFQCEVLYYFLFFCVFVLLMRMLNQPSLLLAMLCGGLIGITHLTKASVMPALQLFVLIAGAKELHILYGKVRRRKAGGIEWGKICKHLAYIGITVAVFLMVIFPYIRNSKRIFGRYFYNVNSTFYMWCDTVDEWKNGPKAHGDRIGWPQMPPDQVPSLEKYLREHTTKQIVNRIIEGHRIAVRSCRWSYGYFKYVVLYALFTLLMGVVNFRQTTQAAKANVPIVAFVLALFCAYFFVNGWYNFMVPQVRHILAFFIPFMVCCIHLHHVIFTEKLPFTVAGVKLNANIVFNILISLILLADIYIILTKRILLMQGGT